METKAAASGFAALSQETRIELMRVLATKGDLGMSAGQLATALKQVPSTLSFHLSALEQAGLVHATRKGRQVIYRVRLSGLRSLFGFLTETCCNGRPELCGDLSRLIPDDVDEVRAMTPAFCFSVHTIPRDRSWQKPSSRKSAMESFALIRPGLPPVPPRWRR